MAGEREQIRFCLALALLAAPLTVAPGRADDRAARPDTAAPATVHEPLAVPAANGLADFRVRLPANAPLLIVTSTLAREGGPFEVSLRAEPAEGADALPSWKLPHPSTPHSPFTDETTLASSSDFSLESQPPPPESREFWLPVRPGAPADASRYVPIQARRIQVGRHIQIYADLRDIGRIDPALSTFLVAIFDDEIRPRSVSRWGTARDIDADGRFTVLLTSWLGRLERPGEPVEGCFRGADLDLSLAPPFGNRCDMVSLDALLTAGPHAKTVLIHEYAHAVLFTRKVLNESGAARASEDEAGWLDEAISHLVEDDHAPSHPNSNLDRRLAAYQAAPEAFPLVLPDDPEDGAAFAPGGGHRGAATLFLRWCARGMTDPDVLLRRLARPGARGVANIERATGLPFPELLRGWSVSQFLEPEAIGSARPAAATLTLKNPSHHWRARPTSSHYVLITPGENPPYARVRINAPPEAELQVTAVPLAVEPTGYAGSSHSRAN